MVALLFSNTMIMSNLAWNYGPVRISTMCGNGPFHYLLSVSISAVLTDVCIFWQREKADTPCGPGRDVLF